MTLTLIQDLLIILATGFVACLVCRSLRVSVLIGYLAAGILLGPGCLDLVTDEQHQVAHFAEAGVFLLLFAIGLEFSLDDARRLGSRLFVAGATQTLVACVPDDVTAIQIVRAIREINPVGRLIVRCRYHANVQRLIRAGADRVVSEEFTASLALLENLRHMHEDQNPHG